MAKVKFIAIPQGFRRIAKSGGIENLLGELAGQVAANCNRLASPDKMQNPPFSSHTEQHPTRAVAHAGTASPHGWYKNKRNHMLQKSLSKMR